MLLHTDSSRPYPASYYDDEMCLKVPPLLWMVIIYLSRSVILPIAMALGHVAGVDDVAIAKFHVFWSASGLVPSLIAVPVLITLFRRVPAAAGWMRWVWAHGRTFLAVAAILDMVLLSRDIIPKAGLGDSSLWSMFAAALDCFSLFYIVAARRVRHVFSEFPLPLH
jgi:hypothetical protein